MSAVTDRNVYCRALLLALAVCALMYGLAALVVHLPIDEPLREELALIVLAPIIAISRLFTYVVDWLGPAGTQEPASHYLPRWAQRSLGILAIALFVGVVFSVVVALMSWRERARRRVS